MNNIGHNIRRLREQNGYTQDYMAAELDITQATYARIESEEIKLSTDRLQKIADILKTDIYKLFDSNKITIKNQTFNEGVYGNGYIENLHVESKEAYKKLIEAQEKEIEYLKKQIDFLHSLLTK
jgi:transcriptional regulator with XRE-family HTH domain